MAASCVRMEISNEWEPCNDLPAWFTEVFGSSLKNVNDGIVLPARFVHGGVAQSAKSLQVLDDDVFVMTYPKCGTTWMQV